MGNNIELPARLKCSLGGEWKPLAGFSNKNLEQARRALASGKTAATTGVKCREHSGAPLDELQCEGPCSKIRPLEQFSKSSRRNGTNKCIECTAWVETCEPGCTPFAAPNNQVVYDEAARGHNIPDVPDDFYDSHDKLLAPNSEGVDVARLSNLGASDFMGIHAATMTPQTGSSANLGPSRGSVGGPAPRYGSGGGGTAAAAATSEASASKLSVTQGRSWMPPHLSSKAESTMTTTTTTTTETSSISTATTMREARLEKQVTAGGPGQSSSGPGQRRTNTQSTASGYGSVVAPNATIPTYAGLLPVTVPTSQTASNPRKFAKALRLPVDHRKQGNFKFEIRDPEPDMDDWDSPDEL